jgi:MFS family permease
MPRTIGQRRIHGGFHAVYHVRLHARPLLVQSTLMVRATPDPTAAVARLAEKRRTIMAADIAMHGRVEKKRAQTVARALAARGIHYGWVMVALTFLLGVCAAAAMSVPGVLLTPISKDLGWSIGELSGPLGLRMTLFGLAAPFAGGLILLHGPRKVMTWSAILLIAGLLVAITMTMKWQLWLALGIAMGIAPGMTALVMATTIATRWFTVRRGLVLGILSAGNATGQLIFLMPAAWIAQTYGWRMALVPPVFMIGLLAVLVALLAIDRPADIGLAPCGEDKVLPDLPRPTDNVFAISTGALRIAAGSLVFWVLAFTFFTCGVSSFGLMPHFVSLCGDFGISPMISTSLLAAIGVFDLIGTVGSGWLSDRFDNRWLLAGYYGFRGLSLIWLPYSGFSLVGLSFFAMFYGLDFIATVPPSVRLTAQAFGREQAPLVFGWIFAAHQLGAGLMAFAAGISRDVLASYLPGFFAAGVLCIVAVLSLWLLKGRSGPVLAALRTA